MIFEEEFPYMSHEARKEVVEIEYWFSSPRGTYLKVFGS